EGGGAQGVYATLAGFRGDEVNRGSLGRGGRGHAHIVAHHADAHAARVERVGVAGLNVVAAGAALVDDAVGVYEVVVADVAPAAGVGVEVPDGAHAGGEVGVGVGGGGVVDDDVGDPPELGYPGGAALSFGRSPLGPGHERGLGGIGGGA